MGEWADEESYQEEEDDDNEPPFIIDNPVIKYSSVKALLVMTTRGLFWVPKSILIEHTEKVLIIPAWFEPKYFKDDRP